LEGVSLRFQTQAASRRDYRVKSLAFISRSLVRILDIGGMIWESDAS
jgi:hypothetical protein